MEKHKSKVSNVLFSESYESQYGRMYKFSVTFVNGETGFYTTTMEHQNKFVIGEEVEYTLEVKSNKTGLYNAIKPASKSDNEWKYRLESLQMAVQICQRGAMIDTIIEKAKEFEYYLNTGKIKGTPKQNQSNDLPF